MIATSAGKMNRPGELNEKLYVTFLRYILVLLSLLSFLKSIIIKYIGLQYYDTVCTAMSTKKTKEIKDV